MVFPGRGGFGLVCFSLMGTNGFPLFDVSSAGSRFHGRVCTPGRLRRATVFLASPRKTAKKATRLHRSAFGRLPCAAHNGRPAQNSPFGLRQLRRTSPPVAARIKGSDGLSCTPSLSGSR